jgi:hypothetical protein
MDSQIMPITQSPRTTYRPGEAKKQTQIQIREKRFIINKTNRKPISKHHPQASPEGVIVVPDAPRYACLDS